MALTKEKAWFGAKKYGYGWGLPKRWEGWVVLASYIILLQLGAVILAPKHPIAFLGVVLALSTILICICYAKGESAKWRWGNTEDKG